jgi:hypothetical protein
MISIEIICIKYVILCLHLYHYFYCAWITQYLISFGLYKYIGPWRLVHSKFILPNQLALGWHFPYTMKPIDNKSLENPKTINKKTQMQQKHEHNDRKSHANNFIIVPYLVLNNHYVFTMLIVSQYELIG